MGYKSICVECKTAFSKGNNLNTINESSCTKCGQKTILVNHKFKPPPKSDVKKWKIVQLLLENGFRFDTEHEYIGEGIYTKINYPTGIVEVKEFIKKYKKD
jgi:DNA-directed RNA polymerase subunit RPC12/RpoP